MKNSPHFQTLGHGGVAGRREKKEPAIYFTICQLLKATSGIQTHNILISLQIILCLTCILMSLCARTRPCADARRVRAAGIAGQKWAEALADI